MATNLSAVPPIAELLRGDQCLSVRNGRLLVEDLELTELAERFGTPLYVVSESQLRGNVRAFASAFAYAAS